MQSADIISLPHQGYMQIIGPLFMDYWWLECTPRLWFDILSIFWYYNKCHITPLQGQTFLPRCSLIFKITMILCSTNQTVSISKTKFLSYRASATISSMKRTRFSCHTKMSSKNKSKNMQFSNVSAQKSKNEKKSWPSWSLSSGPNARI